MFTVGQKVRCVNNELCGSVLIVGDVYTISRVGISCVKVRGCDFWFENWRFEAVPDEPVKQPEINYERPVWIVRGPNTLLECDSESSACDAAKDFAKLNAGQFFTVLAPITRYIKSDVQEMQLGHFSSAVEYDEEIAMQNAF